jgi:glucose-6-phosphate 1-epimerase
VVQHPIAGPALRLAVPGGEAIVALDGGHVVAWEPRGHKPVLWLSPGRPTAGKALRGGIPVCWPWFADHPTDTTKPAHGFVRTRPWRLVAASRKAEVVRVQLSIATHADDALIWPHSACVDIVVTLGETLALDLVTHNTGTDTFALTQALHTYFAVGDSAKVTVEGFDGLSYADKLDGFSRRRQTGVITFAGEVDRIYDTHDGHAVIIDRHWQRRIEIAKSGSRSSVVWNPGAVKGAQLGDLGSDGWRRFVCVETCNAGRDIVHLDPRAVQTLSATYTVSHLR